MKPVVKWVVARLGHDGNWWVEETSDEVCWGRDSLSLLDPDQVAYLREELKRYEKYGLDSEMLDDAFDAFEVASELPDGRLRLIASERSLTEEGFQLFALPDLSEEDEGVYPDLLDRVSTLRIKLLNETHEYYQELTEQDMDEEIQARNTDRYFSARAIHVFNELEDVLTWKPAEWEDEDEPKPAEKTETEEEEPQE